MKKKQQTTAITKILVGGAGTAAVIALLCCLCGMLVQKEILTLELAKIATVVLAGVAIFVGCFISSKVLGQKRLLNSAMTAVCVILILLLIKMTVLSGQHLEIDWRWIVPIAASVMAGVLSSLKSKRRR